jgi:hypothetical protein
LPEVFGPRERNFDEIPIPPQALLAADEPDPANIAHASTIEGRFESSVRALPHRIVAALRSIDIASEPKDEIGI